MYRTDSVFDTYTKAVKCYQFDVDFFNTVCYNKFVCYIKEYFTYG